MTFTAGQMGATDLLARLVATLHDPHQDGVQLDSITGGDRGVSAVVHTPAGDRYSIAIEWLGDREADR